MSLDERRRYFSENGFLVVKNALGKDLVARMRGEIETTRPFAVKEVMLKAFFNVPSFAASLESSPIIDTVRTIFGKDIVCFKGDYVGKHPDGGTRTPQRTALHVDHEIGFEHGNYINTASSWLNVAIYLTDMTMEHGPFSVVPGSNHRYDMAPGMDMEGLGPEAKGLLVEAGDAVFFYRTTAHAGGFNVSEEIQHILFLSFRPKWALMAGKVEEWPRHFLARLKPETRALVEPVNKAVYLGREYFGVPPRASRISFKTRLKVVLKSGYRRLVRDE